MYEKNVSADRKYWNMSVRLCVGQGRRDKAKVTQKVGMHIHVRKRKERVLTAIHVTKHVNV